MMEVNKLFNPQVKNIGLQAYEKYFVEALKSPDDTHILFYTRDDRGFSIQFSWDNFIVQVDVPYSQIIDLYKDTNMNVAQVTLSDSIDHPFIIKFLNDYLFNRGIREK